MAQDSSEQNDIEQARMQWGEQDTEGNYGKRKEMTGQVVSK